MIIIRKRWSIFWGFYSFRVIINLLFSTDMFLPRLSAFDPETKSEGSIDPLGLVPIADRLSVRLVPGVRERMSHPRYLSMIAAGVAVCQEFQDERIAVDGISSPLQVYEWHVVQALVKNFKNNGLVGLPGSEKASTAMKNNLPLNAARYLRVPSVFGFYGVYKTLARDIGIVQGEKLGEAGDQLTRIWEKEQKLAGYYSGISGEGYSFKMKLKNAIEDGLSHARVERNWNWPFFTLLAEKMHPVKMGRQEAQTIFDLLTNDKEQKRREIIAALITYSEKYDLDKGIDESHFHSFLLKKVRPEIKDLLEAIQTYEMFSRTLTNALESVLYRLSSQSNKATREELERLAEIKYAATSIPEQYLRCAEMLTKVKEESFFQSTFGRFNNLMTSSEFVEALLDHHQAIQKKKPPFGKMPWLDRYQQTTIILRPVYTRKKTLVKNDPNAYVYFYRSSSLLSFLKDLRKLNG